MIKRIAANEALRLTKQYPVLTIVGPRQSGKTTLCQNTFQGYSYVSLEGLEERNLALNDPRAFLARFQPPVIIDEIQRVPSLLSSIQTEVDTKKQNGAFVLTGSQQLELMESLTQSLAGRTAILKLLPLTIYELKEFFHETFPLEHYLYRGFYPRVYDQNLNPTEAYSFYLSTYVERDIRSLINIKDYLTFERFLKICASRTGQVINQTAIGNECGISHHTVNQWLSLLEASFIIYRISPHFRNFSKRMIKSPKLYFYDVGFVAFLLGVERQEQLVSHPLRGALFETMVMGEMLKHRYNAIRGSNLYFYRDSSGREIDCLTDHGMYCVPIEIKSSQTVNDSFFETLHYYRNLQNHDASGVLVYGGMSSYERSHNSVVSYSELFEHRERF